MSNHITKLHANCTGSSNAQSGRRAGLCSVEATCSNPESDEATCIREGRVAALMSDPESSHCTVNSKRMNECADTNSKKNHAKESDADITTPGTFESSMMPINVA